MGYMPGHMTLYFGEALQKMGFDIVNSDIKVTVHQDRNVVTGGQPLRGECTWPAGRKRIACPVYRQTVKRGRALGSCPGCSEFLLILHQTSAPVRIEEGNN